MSSKMNWFVWYRRKLPAWLRFAVWGVGKILGVVLAIATIWIWLPLGFVVYILGSVIEMYIDYARRFPSEEK